MGSHLNFRDPDGIALEFDAPNELALQAQSALAANPSPAEIAAFVAEHLGSGVRPAPAEPVSVPCARVDSTLDDPRSHPCPATRHRSTTRPTGSCST